MRLVFIHGRAQEARKPEDVRLEWISALRDGLNKSGLELPIDPSQVVLPYFGDRLFNLTKILGEIDESAIARGGPAIDPVLAFQAEALEDIRKSAGISDAQVQSARRRGGNGSRPGELAVGLGSCARHRQVATRGERKCRQPDPARCLRLLYTPRRSGRN